MSKSTKGMLELGPILWSMKNKHAEWELGEFTLEHKPTKLAIWVGNGLFFYKIFRAGKFYKDFGGDQIDFTLGQKVRFSWALTKFKFGNEPQSTQRMKKANAVLADALLDKSMNYGSKNP
jgi:hypothetical protein